MKTGIKQFHNGTPVNGSSIDSATDVILKDGRTVESAILSSEKNIGDLATLIASTHNSIYRGKDITANFDDGSFSAAIAAGTFDDIYPGDYIKKSVSISETTYTDYAYVAHIDPFYAYESYANVATHHVALVHVIGITHNMNSSNVTTGGYVGSAMHSYLTGTVLPALQAAFGAEHFVSHQKLYSNAVSTTAYNRFGAATGASSGWAWSTNQFISLLTEAQVYGTTVWSSSGYDTGEAFQQLAIFSLVKPNKVFGNAVVWLRDVVSSAFFAFLNSVGYASNRDASGVFSVCPQTLCK